MSDRLFKTKFEKMFQVVAVLSNGRMYYGRKDAKGAFHIGAENPGTNRKERRQWEADTIKKVKKEKKDEDR